MATMPRLAQRPPRSPASVRREPPALPRPLTDLFGAHWLPDQLSTSPKGDHHVR